MATKALAVPTIKVGVLHSLSGTMAISEDHAERHHADAHREQNKKGGLLGKKLEAVVVDPASDWPLFAEEGARAARKGEGQGRRGLRLLDLGVAQVRAAGLRRAELLLFYPVQYEGEESSSATSSTPAPRRTSRRSRRWTT
jgi:urea transport system substrate-binding protein